MGHPAQKWFFPWGPRSGPEGIRDNVALAAALREAVGADYPLMFDAWMGWDIPLIPHGMGVAAAAHTIAGMPSSLCPWQEYLFSYMEQETALFKYPLKPEGGFITLRDDVYGLGMDLDENKVESRTRVVF
ncbi:hypothetical protein FACS1894110_22300 [Spirochaetia bacterium]|nr:hypothetical protein FACS1894110_22300 [Spirochaetia bacterium]